MVTRSSASSTIPYNIFTYVYCHLMAEMRLFEIAKSRVLAHAPVVAKAYTTCMHLQSIRYLLELTCGSPRSSSPIRRRACASWRAARVLRRGLRSRSPCRGKDACHPARVAPCRRSPACLYFIRYTLYFILYTLYFILYTTCSSSMQRVRNSSIMVSWKP